LRKSIIDLLGLGGSIGGWRLEFLHELEGVDGNLNDMGG